MKRFENPAQLIRHIASETGADINDFWEQYENQTPTE